jgi:hypothetical protein
MIQLIIFIMIGILSLLLLRKHSLEVRIAIAVIVPFTLIALLRAFMIMNGDPPSPVLQRVSFIKKSANQSTQATDSPPLKF